MYSRATPRQQASQSCAGLLAGVRTDRPLRATHCSHWKIPARRRILSLSTTQSAPYDFAGDYHGLYRKSKNNMAQDSLQSAVRRPLCAQRTAKQDISESTEMTSCACRPRRHISMEGCSGHTREALKGNHKRSIYQYLDDGAWRGASFFMRFKQEYQNYNLGGH